MLLAAVGHAPAAITQSDFVGGLHGNCEIAVVAVFGRIHLHAQGGLLAVLDDPVVIALESVRDALEQAFDNCLVKRDRSWGCSELLLRFLDRGRHLGSGFAERLL